MRMSTILQTLLLTSPSLGLARMCWEECGDQGRVERANLIGCRQGQIKQDKTGNILFFFQEKVDLPGPGGLQVRGECRAALHRLQGGHRHAGRGLEQPRHQGHEPVRPLGLLDRHPLGGVGDGGLPLPRRRTWLW